MTFSATWMDGLEGMQSRFYTTRNGLVELEDKWLGWAAGIDVVVESSGMKRKQRKSKRREKKQRKMRSGRKGVTGVAGIYTHRHV